MFQETAIRQINEHSDLKVSYNLEGERQRKKPFRHQISQNSKIVESKVYGYKNFP